MENKHNIRRTIDNHPQLHLYEAFHAPLVSKQPRPGRAGTYLCITVGSITNEPGLDRARGYPVRGRRAPWVCASRAGQQSRTLERPEGCLLCGGPALVSAAKARDAAARQDEAGFQSARPGERDRPTFGFEYGRACRTCVSYVRDEFEGSAAAPPHDAQVQVDDCT